MPGLVGSTQSPDESLVIKEMKLNDYGVIEFGEYGKYSLWKYYNFTSISHKKIKCFFIGFLLIQCNNDPDIKNKKTSTNELSPEFDKFVQRYWCQSEKSSEDKWNNVMKNLLKNQLQVEIQKRTSKL